MTVDHDLYNLDVGSARLFLAVDELGSVSKAAQRCGLTQPSATARLVKLERQLGVQLLERGPLGSEVTQIGQQLLARCSALVAAAEELAVEAKAITVVPASVLKIAATDYIARHHLVEWIAAADLGDVEVRLTAAPTAEVASLVRAGEVAIGFMAGPSAPLGLRSAEVEVCELEVVVSPGHRWARRNRRLSGVELASARLIMRAEGSGTRDVVQFALAEFELGSGEPWIEVSSDVCARIAAINGEGVAILPARSVAADIAAGRLLTVPARKLELRQPLRAAWKGTKPAGMAARTLLSQVLAR